MKTNDCVDAEGTVNSVLVEHFRKQRVVDVCQNGQAQFINIYLFSLPGATELPPSGEEEIKCIARNMYLILVWVESCIFFTEAAKL